MTSVEHWTFNTFTRSRFRAQHGYVRIQQMSIEEFEALHRLHPNRKYAELNGIRTTILDKRLRVLQDAGYTCQACGLQGDHVWQETHHMLDGLDVWGCIKNPPPVYGCPFEAHINVYAFDDSSAERMLTVDHILPRSLGGSNRYSNLTCLCALCNRKKGSDRDWLTDLPRNVNGSLIARPHRQKPKPKHQRN